MVTYEGIGRRLAAYRRRRGMSQAALAGLVGRSESWLSQVERGARSVDRLSVLIDLSELLHVEVADLIGRPWRLAPNGGPLIDGLDAVRHTLTAYPALAGLTDNEPPTLAGPALAELVDHCHREYQAARYEAVIAALPDVLSSVDRLGPSPVYVSAYLVTAKLTTKLGAADLAWIAADRAAAAANDLRDWGLRGVAAYQVVCALMRNDQTDHAESLAIAMASRVSGAAPDNPVTTSVAGSLWLIAAVIAARRNDRGNAWDRLATAQSLADSLAPGANYAYTAFSAENVGIHRVSVAAELGDAADALREAGKLDLASLPAELRSRRAQVHLDLAWAEAQRRRDGNAVTNLLSATDIAPEALKFNVMGRELVRELIYRGRADGRQLDTLATRAAILV